MKLFNVMVLATVAIAGKNNGDGRNENIPDGKFFQVFLLESPFFGKFRLLKSRKLSEKWTN